MSWISAVKQFHYVSTPLGAMVLLVAIALLFAMFGKKSAASKLVFSALALIWIAATPWVPLLGAEKLLSDMVLEIPYDELPSSEAIVVYSWIHPFKHDAKELRAYWSQPLVNASRLYKKKPIPIFVASSHAPAEPDPQIDEIVYARAFLNRFGVPDKDIHVIPQTPSTRQASLGINTKLRALGIKSIVLIESDQRMARKYLSLKRLFGDTDQIIYPFSNTEAKQAYHSPTYQLNQWLPTVGSLQLSTLVLHEWLGIVAYYLLGWI